MIATQGGRDVGRIAAIVNRAHNAYYGDKVGFFGFFDCIDDKDIAKQLFDTARAELAKRGFTSARGPYNPSVNDECGVLIEGFDSSPFAMMTWNPPYYQSLYEAAGLERARDLYAFYLSSTLNPPERILKIVERLKKSSGLTLRNINLKKLDDDLKIIHGLYNVTLDRNWGFVPITLEELQFAAEDLRAIADPSLVMIAEKNGVPAGFSLAVPNINEFMYATRGLPKLLRILKFAWLLKTRRPKEARLAVLGVKPEFRNSGIGALFYAESLLRGKRYLGGEMSWVEESNQEIMKGITAMGGKRYKSYRIYESAVN